VLVLLRVMPNSRLPPDTTRQCCPCRVRRCELSRPEKFVLCSAVALRSPTHSDAERTCRAVGPTQFPPPHQTRKTVLSVSCLTCRCEFGDWSERVQTSNFLSATVFSCRESNSSERDTDKTVLSCLAGVAV